MVFNFCGARLVLIVARDLWKHEWRMSISVEIRFPVVIERDLSGETKP